ncbi:MAG: hypothetical protein K2L03_08310, partial [Bacteroidales bacterium]|nr:hypothetical protein [Bacteroidales bacterium]
MSSDVKADVDSESVFDFDSAEAVPTHERKHRSVIVRLISLFVCMILIKTLKINNAKLIKIFVFTKNRTFASMGKL